MIKGLKVIELLLFSELFLFLFEKNSIVFSLLKLEFAFVISELILSLVLKLLKVFE